MNPIFNKITDILIILALPAVYAFISNRPYAEAFGFSIAGGLVGTLIYIAIMRIPALMRYGAEQSGLRKYAMGCILFAFFGVPTFAKQSNEARTQAEVDFVIGQELGKAQSACRLANYTKRNYCPDFETPKEMDLACSNKLAKYVPAGKMPEMEQIFLSDRYKKEIQMLYRQIDHGFKTGKANDLPLRSICQQYESFVSDTYKTSIKAIESNIARLSK